MIIRFISFFQLANIEIENAHFQSEKLLLNILPKKVAEELKKSKKSIKKATEVYLCKLPKKILKEIKSKNYKSFFQSRQIILKYEIKARDFIYPLKILDNKIYKFFSTC